MIQSPRVLLISMPWQKPNMPSIQLGLLKSYLGAHGIAVDARHLHLEILSHLSYPAYLVCESVILPAEAFDDGVITARPMNRIEAHYAGAVRQCMDEFVASIPSGTYDLVGFTVSTTNQFHLSIALARKLRTVHPNLPIVFGGFICASRFAEIILQEHNRDISFLVTGEGERPLLLLAQEIMKPEPRFGSVHGLIWSDGERIVRNPEAGFMSLDDGFHPDYREFFVSLEELRAKGAAPSDDPIIPIESSRGCAWNHCQFCNHNALWRTYRRKCPERFANELDRYQQDHDIKQFYFVDNSCTEEWRTWELIAESGKGVCFFRVAFMPDLQPRNIELLRRVGVREILVGIESFSSATLKKMRKNTTPIQNLSFLKHCLALGISPRYNLISHFPSETADDLAETIRVIDFADIFWPPTVSKFELRDGSGVYRQPEEYGITIQQDCDGSVIRRWDDEMLVCNFKLTRPNGPDYGTLEKRVLAWRLAHNPNALKLAATISGEEMTLHDFRLSTHPRVHILDHLDSELYTYCEAPRSQQELFEAWPGEKVIDRLARLVTERLLFESNGEYLSMAPRVDVEDPRLANARSQIPPFLAIEVVPSMASTCASGSNHPCISGSSPSLP